MSMSHNTTCTYNVNIGGVSLSKPSQQEKAYIARVLVGVALACGNEVSQVLVKVLSLSNNCTCEA